MSQDPLPLVMCLMPMRKVFAQYLHPFGPHLESSFGGFVISGHDAKLWSLKVYCTGILLLHILSHGPWCSVWSSTQVAPPGHHKCGLFRKVCRSAETEVFMDLSRFPWFCFFWDTTKRWRFLIGLGTILCYGCSGWNYTPLLVNASVSAQQGFVSSCWMRLILTSNLKKLCGKNAVGG